MAATRLLEVSGVIAIEADDDGTALRIDAFGEDAGPMKLSIPLSPAEIREFAANLLHWADAVEPPTPVASLA